MNRSLPKIVWSLLQGLPQKRRVQLVFLLGLMLISGLAEFVSIGAILPFLAILADPERAQQTPLIAGLISALGLDDGTNLRWQLTLLFASAAVGAGAIRFVLVFAVARINFGIGHVLGSEIYRRALFQPYEVHASRNSAEILGAIHKVDEVVWAMLALLNLVSAAVIGSCIAIALIAFNTWETVVALMALGAIYAIVFVMTRSRLLTNSQVVSEALNKRVQIVQEGLGGIRNVIIDQMQPIFAKRFNEIDWPMRQAQASNNTIGPAPRFAIEALGMVVVAVLAYVKAVSAGGLAAALPALGALALGAQRLMPLLQQAYHGWAHAHGTRQLLDDVTRLLHQPLSEDTLEKQVEPLPFTGEIRLHQMSFQYQAELPPVLENVSFCIKKGARVGFIGVTGSGKSTIMDLIMGLLQATKGEILVDGVPLKGKSRQAWRRNISHVPQTIFLADSSIEENIAFGIPKDQIDSLLVRKAAKQACIDETIESWPNRYQTLVGERGIRLSGGQRQRIGIARALYKQADVIVFDEATSALDNETEQEVIEAIESLGSNLTVLIVAHRLSTLRNCSQIIELKNAGVHRIVSYQDIMNDTQGFTIATETEAELNNLTQ